jgi:mercuric ion binding protein
MPDHGPQGSGEGAGVGSAKVDFKTHRAVVAFDPAKTTPELLTKATTDAGFPSTVKQLQ